VKISEAVEFESKAAVLRRSDLPEKVIWRADSLQTRFVILSAGGGVICRGNRMRPRERRDSGQGDLLRSRLDQIIDMRHPLATQVDWAFLEKTFGEAYADGPGQPPLPTRLMAGLTILKYAHDLSDEVLCERWLENPLSAVLRRRVLLSQGAVRPLVDDALAPANGRGATERARAREPFDGDADRRGQAGGLFASDRRYDRAAESDGASDRRQADPK
jgi:IS5 family transposase